MVTPTGSLSSHGARPNCGVDRGRWFRTAAAEAARPTEILQETWIMNTTTGTALVIASALVGMLALLFGGGLATGTMMGGAMTGGGSMQGSDGMWLSVLLVVALGAALVPAIFGRQ
jgi:hypothetical protein